MKTKYFKISFLFCFLFVNTIFSQAVNLNEISSNKIQTKIFGNNEISYLSSKDMKEGSNTATLPSGNTVKIIKTNGIVSSITLNESVYKINSSGSDGLSFGCFGNYCACNGEEDCKNMFGSGKCQDCFKCAVCVDDYCVCNAVGKKVVTKGTKEIKAGATGTSQQIKH